MKKRNRFSGDESSLLLRIVKIMKLTTFILLASTMMVSASLYSQSTKVTLKFREISFAELFQEIENQTEFRFAFSSSNLDPNQKVKVDMEKKTLEEILDKTLPEGIAYEIIDRYVVIMNASEKTSTVAGQQQNSVSGKITDTGGQPLPGVTVVVKGTTHGTVTNADGNYSLSNIPENATLVFSFVGMRSQEVVVGSQTNINIVMEVDVIGIEEVVAIGYGTATRKEFTGSVSSIRLENSPVALAPNTNALESLKGNVTGLNIGATNTAGGQPSMIIRGQNSINGSNNPLIVLDGAIYLGSLSDINPNDISTVDVLKDAVSASVYGSRAANGVIAITTKRGKSQKPLISFNTSTGIQKNFDSRELITGEEWLKYANLREGNPIDDTRWMLLGEAANYAAGKTIDWVDEVTRMGVIQDYQLSVSGAGEGINYYLSTAYSDNKGIIVGDDFNRISVLGKINTDITSWLKIGADASYTKQDFSGLGADLFVAQRITPYGNLYRDDQGNLEKYPYEGSQMNPLWGVNDGTRENTDIRENFRLNTYAVVEIPWVKGLSYRLNYSNNTNLNHSGTFNTERYFVAEGNSLDRYAPSVVVNYLTQAGGNIRDDKTTSYVWDNILSYKNSFGKHNVDVTAVYTQDELEFKSVNNRGSDFAANGIRHLG